jgi:hypothetical protein
LVAVLSSKHVDAFGSRSREAFLADAEALKLRLASMSVPQRLVALAQLVATIGDQHSSIALDRLVRQAQLLPITLLWLDDGLFIAGAEQGRGDLLGREVTTIGGRPIAELLPLVTSVTAAENEGVRRVKFGQLASSYDLLYALGLVEADGHVAVGVRSAEGGEERVLIAPLPPRSAPNLRTLPDRSAPDLALSLRPGQGNTLLEVLPESELVYLRYDRCLENPSQPFRTVAERVTAALKEMKHPRLIIDLRNNMGGDSRVIRPLLEEVESLRRTSSAMGAPHAVVVLIGPRTQSSAAINALELKQRLGATLLGEKSGQRPSHLGEVRTVVLPNTSLTLWYSTKRFDAGAEWAAQDGLPPDQRIPSTAKDFLAGRDPVLEAAVGLPR